ncbi:MAG: hypothetical protein WCK00_17000, partial [Deltaproteobacteria bacterium]
SRKPHLPRTRREKTGARKRRLRSIHGNWKRNMPSVQAEQGAAVLGAEPNLPNGGNGGNFLRTGP